MNKHFPKYEYIADTLEGIEKYAKDHNITKDQIEFFYDSNGKVCDLQIWDTHYEVTVCGELIPNNIHLKKLQE